MLNTDRDAVICDLAETYHVFNMGSLPARTVAILCCGLGNDSRIKMKMSGQKIPAEMLIQISILDQLNLLLWSRTKDAQKHRNKPKSILNEILHPSESDVVAFDSGEDFDKAYKEIIGKAVK